MDPSLSLLPPVNPKIMSISSTLLRWALLIFKVKVRIEGIKCVKFNCSKPRPLSSPILCVDKIVLELFPPGRH